MSAPQESAQSAQPFAGKTIALVHPAWHSCGSYTVFVGQVAAWRRLGARVLTIAVSDQPGFKPERAWLWRNFVRATPEMNAQPRFFAGAPLHRLASLSFLRKILWPYVHGDQAIIRTGMADIATISSALSAERIDLVHCNHFFCMPIALRLAQNNHAPIMLESHDVQARQFTLMNEGLPWLKPHVGYDAMLAREIFWMRQADLQAHLNADEGALFQSLMPDCDHALLYPPVPPVPTGPGGEDVIVVSSRNRANVESVLWFLRSVAPALKTPFRIYGSVDAGVRAADRALYEAYAGEMVGRVDDLASVYANARLALLPNVDGTGISIKTIEAMASGLPLVAHRAAFRGMNFNPEDLENVILAETGEDFAAAIAKALAKPSPTPEQRQTSATRKIYESTFSAQAYPEHIAKIALPLLAQEPRFPS